LAGLDGMQGLSPNRRIAEIFRRIETIYALNGV